MKRTRYELGDKVWAVENAKKKNLTNKKAAEEATEYLRKKHIGFTGNVSVEVFRRWKSLPVPSQEDCMSSKARHATRSSAFETGVLHFLRLLSDPFRTENQKRVKYTLPAVRKAAIEVRKGTLLVLQKSSLWKDLEGAEKIIDQTEGFRCSLTFCKRVAESLMREERKKKCLSFINFTCIKVSVERFQECLERTVANVLKKMDLDATALFLLKDAKKVERLRTLKWGDSVVGLDELRKITAAGRISTAVMYMYCAEMVRRRNESEGRNNLWVIPPSLLCKILERSSCLVTGSINEIRCKLSKEAGLIIDKAKDAEKFLYPLPRTENGGFHQENGEWCLVLVDEGKRKAYYFESRCAADVRFLKFNSAAEMCILLTGKLKRQELKKPRKRDLSGYTHVLQHLGEHYLPRIKNFESGGRFVCKVVEWVCTKSYPRMKTYQEDVRKSGKFIRRVVVEGGLRKM